jgi:phage replication-related protein YjqB (UPF0714/DUF867 family)
VRGHRRQHGQTERHPGLVSGVDQAGRAADRRRRPAHRHRPARRHIEPHTDDQAEQVRLLLTAKRASMWLCRGWRPGGGVVDRWHITSADLAPDCFPRLHTVIGRGFTHAVAFHGSGGSQVLVGGGAASSDLQQAIAAAIRLATGLAVRVATPDDRLGGNDPRNVVNRLTADGANGVQIEQPLAARRDHGPAIARSVAIALRARPVSTAAAHRPQVATPTAA